MQVTVKRKYNIRFSLIIVLLVAVFCLPLMGCSNSPEEERDEFTNYYNGNGEDFVLDKWQSNAGLAFKVDKKEEGFLVSYNKVSSSNQYGMILSNFEGRMSDFEYLVFEFSGSADIVLQVQTVFYTGYLDKDGNDGKESLIGELGFTIDQTRKTYAFRYFPETRLAMNQMTDVWIFPEAGHYGIDYIGSFNIYKSYFTNTLPEDAELINKDGNGTEASAEVKYGKWTNENDWTGYRLTQNSYGEVDVSFPAAEPWGFIARWLDDFDLSHNAVELKFSNTENSVEHMSFRLRGDKKELIREANYNYWTYYEAELSDWYIGEAVVEDGVTTVLLDISSARHTIKNHISEGARLAVFIESLTDKKNATIDFDGVGNMSILSVRTLESDQFENTPNLSPFVTQDGLSYSIRAEQADEVQISWTTIDKSYANVFHEFSSATTTGAKYRFTIKNTGANAISFQYTSSAGSQDGDFIDVTLAVNEEKTIEFDLVSNATFVKFFFESAREDAQLSNAVAGSVLITAFEVFY